MFESIDEIRMFRKRFNGKMFLSGVPAFRQLADVEEKVLQGGAIPAKDKELIALGISVSHACYGCIEYHVSRAIELGANRQEIAEATAIAVALRGSIADWPARFVFKVMDELAQGAQMEGDAPASR